MGTQSDRDLTGAERLSYLDFELEVGPGSGREYPVAVIRSPAGEARETMRFPFDELALENRLKDLQIALLRSGGKRRQMLSPEEQTVQGFGRALFDALLSGEVRSRYDVSWREARQQGKGLRIKLRIQPPELAVLPWEFMYDSRQAEYVCLSRGTPLVRYLELPQIIQPLRVTPPLRILGMIASPRDQPPLDVMREKQRIEEAIKDLRARGLVEMTWLAGQTWRDLQRAMRGGPWHIFHFIGHGGFDRVADEGLIALPDDNGFTDTLHATELGRLLADHGALRLALLNSCEGARGGERDIFSSTASILVRRGVPAVLAMQYEISDRAAIEFSRAFYEALADGYPVDAAASEARKAVSLAIESTMEWGTPVLYMRSPDGVLFSIERPVETERAAQERREREAREQATREEAARQARLEVERQEQARLAEQAELSRTIQPVPSRPDSLQTQEAARGAGVRGKRRGLPPLAWAGLGALLVVIALFAVQWYNNTVLQPTRVPTKPTAVEKTVIVVKPATTTAPPTSTWTPTPMPTRPSTPTWTTTRPPTPTWTPTPTEVPITNWPMGGYDAGNTHWNREEKALYPPLKELWRYTPPGGAAALDSVTAASGVAILSSMADGDKNVVWAVEALSGKHLWKFVLTGGGGGAMGVSPAILGDLAFFGGQHDDNLYAIEIKSGKIRWQAPGMSGMYSLSPKIAGGILYANTIGRSIWAFDPQTGRKIWELPEKGRQSDLVLEQGVLLQGGVYGEPLTGIDSRLGKVIWQTPGRINATITAWEGLAFAFYTGDSPVKTSDGSYKYDRIAAFRVRDGSRAWETGVTGNVKYGSMAYVDGVLYAINRQEKESTLYALDPKTGKIINQRDFSVPLGAMAGANGALYVCSYQRSPVYALEPRTLRTIWTTPAEIERCGDLGVANGRLYVVQGWAGLVAYGK